MLNATAECKNAIANGISTYEYYADVVLADGTELNLVNSDFWNNGVKYTDSISSDSQFDIGSAIINSATLVLNNIHDKFTKYDFTDAKVTLSISVGGLDKIQRGVYVVNEAKYNGSIITLNLYDYMCKFDRLYSASTLSYPATFTQILTDACQNCGVTFGSIFTGGNTSVTSKPTDKNLTFRELISYIAQYVGGYARMSVKGELEIKAYTLSQVNGLKDGLYGGVLSDYTTGDTADGGTFNPWNTGYVFDSHQFTVLTNANVFANNFSHDFGVDSILITGIEVQVKSDNDVFRYKAGTEGYVLVISDNPLITKSNAQAVANQVYAQIGRYIFHAGTASVLKNPLVEAGDPAIIYDVKNRTYNLIVSSVEFSSGSAMRIRSSAETPTRQAAARNTQLAKTYTDLQEKIYKEQSLREQQMKNLSDALAAKSGLYETEETTSSGTIYYMHDKPALSDSKVVWKLTSDALGVSTDGGKTWNAGLQVNGDLITRILSATGIDADWIKTGTISDRSGRNAWNLSTGTADFTFGSDSEKLNVKTGTFEGNNDKSTTGLMIQGTGQAYFDGTFFKIHSQKIQSNGEVSQTMSSFGPARIRLIGYDFGSTSNYSELGLMFGNIILATYGNRDIYIQKSGMNSAVTLKDYIKGVMNGTY